MSAPVRDPSLSSYYVTDAFYRELRASFTDWQRDDRLLTASAERDRFRGLIEKEARLLDRLAFDDWLAMYARECIYWVPGTPEGGDPRREIAMSFDDRRRMEDRIYRLRTGYAWSQAPKSRTVRMIPMERCSDLKRRRGCSTGSPSTTGSRCTRANASTGCPGRPRAAIRGARSLCRSTTAAAWRTASTGCARAMPGRRRRNRAPCG